jgi:hypothetical protein
MDEDFDEGTSAIDYEAFAEAEAQADKQFNSSIAQIPHFIRQKLQCQKLVAPTRIFQPAPVLVPLPCLLLHLR